MTTELLTKLNLRFNLTELKTFKYMNDNKFYKDNKNYIWQLFTGDNIELTKPNPETFTMIAELNNLNTRVYTVQPMVLYKENKTKVSPLFAENNRIMTERTNNIMTIVNRFNLTKLKSNIAGMMDFYKDNNNMVWMVDTNFNHTIPQFMKPAPTDYVRIANLNKLPSINYGIQDMVL